MSEPMVQVKIGALRAKLDRGTRDLVQSVRFFLETGEKVALVGETGSGKTMIARFLMGLLSENVEAVNCTLVLEGTQMPRAKDRKKVLGREIVTIPQNGHECLNPSRTVYAHLKDALVQAGEKRGTRAMAAELLSRAGFADADLVLDRYPFELSGGMAQRVTIAIALCTRPKLVIADEPTNGLDRTGRESFLVELDALFPGAAKLIITHDFSVADLCDRVLVLCGGRLLESDRAENLRKEARHPYTVALLGALVENGLEPCPNLRKGISPCPFYHRCPVAQEVCQKDFEVKTLGEKEWWCAVL